MFIVDAHLDLSYNAVSGRDVTRPAAEQPITKTGEIATVGLPDLRAGGVGLVCATIFCEPAGANSPGYRNADEAYTQAMQQLAIYHDWIARGEIRFVSRRADLPPLPLGEGWGEGMQETRERVKDPAIPHPGPLPKGEGTRRAIDAILLLEGADAFRSPRDVHEFFTAGLRIVGLAWHRTRYAGGTGEPGPLTPAGVELVRELDRFGIIHDASHLAEESFWQLLDLTHGPIIASHSNCRAIVPGDRHLSDDMIRAIAARGGVIGINFFDKFLLPPAEYGRRRATLDDVVRHVDHICQLTGNANHVAIGTDMDGGLGREQIPIEIQTSADLPKLAAALAKKYSEADVTNIMGGNWLAYFQRHLADAM